MSMNEKKDHDFVDSTYQNFAKIRTEGGIVEDATFQIGSFKKANNQLADKDRINAAISNRDYNFLREVSNFFYEVSGIYGRLCRYLAYLYRYDWMVTPYISNDTAKSEKVLQDFSKTLTHLDAFRIKQMCGDMALKVIRNGAYYGYVVDGPTRSVIQELPAEYCRSRFNSNGKPVVEFNVQFFDDMGKDVNTDEKMAIIKSFPKEFQKGYVGYKSGKRKQWLVLDSKFGFKFSLNNSDMPMLMSVIPAIIDLDEAQELDKKKMLQELLKIVIQQMPLDKNGELIFDVDEALELHQNAVQMLSKAIGVDILTTFAEIKVENLADKNSSTTKDDLQKVERAVYNEAGVSQMLFATDGNLALEKSIANDEAAIYHLLLQFEEFFNDMIDRLFNKNAKKLAFRFSMLTTTIYNYKEMAKMYKEQAMLGYSKLLPQIALGQSQSSILATAHFENEILDLAELMVPLQMSSTQSGKEEDKGKGKAPSKEGAPKADEKAKGRPEKEDSQKSEKTIQNKESMS